MSESIATAPEGEMAQASAMPEEVSVSLPDPRDYVDPDAEAGASDDASDDAPSEAPPAPPEEVEFDLGGTKITMAKGGLSDDAVAAIQKWTKTAQANHTQRSQDVADQRRAVEAEYVQAQQFRQLGEGLRDKFSEGMAIRRQLDQWRTNFDERLWGTNPDEARRQSDLAGRMERQLQGIAGEVEQAESRLEQVQRERETLAQRSQMDAFEVALQEGRKVVEQAIPAMKDAKAQSDLISYAVKNGVDAKDAESWSLNPAAAMAFYKAMLFDRAQAAGTAAIKPVAPGQPVKGLAGTGSATPSDPSQMSTGQMAAHLKARGIIR